jgi:hypothetical protein
MTEHTVPSGFIVDKRDADGVTLLMEAARQGEYKRLQQCLDEGSDINAVDYAGNNALMHALLNKEDTIAVILISRDIDAGKPALNGSTPLLEACAAQMPEVIERLLKKKVPLDAQNKHGSTALMTACAFGDGWAACRLVEEGADFDMLKNEKGLTALDTAHVGLRGRDLLLFERIVEKRREQIKIAEARAQAERERISNENIRNETVLQRDVKTLKRVVFRPKAF